MTKTPRKLVAKSAEMGRFIALAKDALGSCALGAVPSVVEAMAVRILALVEEERGIIAGKVIELSGEVEYVTSHGLEWLAADIREAERDGDGEFKLSDSEVWE